MNPKGVTMNTTSTFEGQASWQKIVAAYSKPDLRKSIWQTINSLIPYFALFYISMRSVDISLWLTIPLALRRRNSQVTLMPRALRCRNRRMRQLWQAHRSA
jgi:fatty acid desaturase